MNVLRVKERQCPRCGRGLRSGFQYPDCGDRDRHGMNQADAHRIFCMNFADDICADCYRERRLENPLLNTFDGP